MADGTNIGIINLGLDINKALFNKQLNGIATGAASTVKNTFKPLGNMIAGALAIGSITAFTKSCLGLGSDLSEVQNVVDVTFEGMASKVNEFASSAIEEFGLSETAAKKMMGTYGAMSKSFGFNPQEVYDMSEAITGLTADVASFYNLETDEAYTKMKSIWTGETEALKELGVVMTQTALDQYALNEGFGKTTASMTEQEKVMLRYRFVQSQLSDAAGDFARTSDGWANQTRVLTLRFQQLKATLGQGLINLFTPIVKMINTFISGLQGAANAFLRLTEIITGKEAGSMGNVATDLAGVSGAAGDASDNISGMGDSAAGAAKKALRALMGFDQIQKIGENSSSDGSGGSAGGAGASSAGSGAIASEFAKANEEASKLEKTLVEMVDKVKKAWQTGDFTEIGKMVGGKINEGLEGIKWDDIKGTIKKISKSIATFFNGFIKEMDWNLLGETVAEGINTGILGIDTFLTTFSWKDSAKAVADTFNGFLKKTDWNLVGKTIADGINAITDYLTTLVKEIDFKKAADAVGETFSGFCKNIDMGDAAEVILTILSTKLALKVTKDLFDGAGTSISKSLAKKLAEKLGIEIAEEAGIGTAIKTGIVNAITVHGGLSGIATTVGTTISTAFTTDLPLLFGAGTFAECATAIVGGFAGAVAAAFVGWNLGNFIYECITGEDTSDIEWGDYLGENFHISEWGDALKQLIIDASKNWNPIQWIYEEITGKEHKENAGFDFYVNIVGKIDETTQQIKDWFSDKKEEVKTFVANTKASFIDRSKELIEEFNDKKEKTKEFIANAKASLSDKFEELREEFADKKEKTKDFIVNAKGNVESTFVDMKEKWDNLSAKAKDLVANAKTEGADKLSKIKEYWNGITGGTKDLKANGSTKNEDKMKKMKDAWTAIVGGTKKLKANATTKGYDALKKIKNVWKDISEKSKKISVSFSDNFTAPIKRAWNALARSINSMLGKIPVIGSKVSKLPVFSGYATGGFPEEGPFMMNRGEIAGKFSNGKGVVANNMQITKGISDAVGPSVYNAVKSAFSSSAIRIRIPQLATVTNSNTDKTLEKMLDVLYIIASGSVNSETVAVLRELLAYIKNMDRDVYMDAEKVTKVVTDIINRNTDATGVCQVKV